METKIISVWSGPRNISTALMYAFAQRKDTLVVDEPLYAHYLLHSDTKHPAEEAVLATQENDGNKVMQSLLNDIFCDVPVLFLKQMAHHLIALDHSFLSKMTNVLLIREPKAVIHSFAKVIKEPKLSDIGIKRQFEMYDIFAKMGENVPIIDSAEVLKNPALVLEKLCEQIGIPFTEKMLSWKKGARKEDGIWAEYWYANVHQSTGFKKYEPKTIDLDEKLLPLYAESLPFYEFLYDKAIKVV
ncbi:MAG: hypothetical protein ACPG5B_15780 [Chitinophagales bacterium]